MKKKTEIRFKISHQISNTQQNKLCMRQVILLISLTHRRRQRSPYIYIKKYIHFRKNMIYYPHHILNILHYHININAKFLRTDRPTVGWII